VAFDLLRRWFDDFAEAAAGHRDVPPVPEPTIATRRRLVEASRGPPARGVAPVQFMLRLLWPSRT